MGHDYLDLAGGHVHLNDFHIKTLQHLFAHCASGATPDSLGTDAETLAELRAFLGGWDCLGPGVFVGTDFNTFATSPTRFAVLRSLFNQTLIYITTFGDEIPLDYLDHHVSTPAMQFAVSQPTTIYRDAVSSLIDLIPP